MLTPPWYFITHFSRFNSCKYDFIQFSFFLQEIQIKMAQTWLDEMD